MATTSPQPAPPCFDFDLGVFRLSAIKKAAYRFAGDFNVQVDQISATSVRVTVAARHDGGKNGVDPARLPSEVLDQELRELVAEETKSVRDLLLAQAFSGLALIDPVGETANYQEDPLGIVTNAGQEQEN